MILYIASTNPGKIKEFKQAADDYGVEAQPVPKIQSLPLCVEDGETFEANARKKALHFSRYVNGLLMADDSGICVDALDGAPGILSARFAGPNAGDEENNQLLLRMLREVEDPPSGMGANQPGASRSAHYICAIALAEGDKILTTTEGRTDGVVLDSPRGSGGFGYDPLFYFPPLGKTFAELSPEAKLGISHRGGAFRKLLDYLGAGRRVK